MAGFLLPPPSSKSYKVKAGHSLVPAQRSPGDSVPSAHPAGWPPVTPEAKAEALPLPKTEDLHLKWNRSSKLKLSGVASATSFVGMGSS